MITRGKTNSRRTLFVLGITVVITVFLVFGCTLAYASEAAQLDPRPGPEDPQTDQEPAPEVQPGDEGESDSGPVNGPDEYEREGRRSSGHSSLGVTDTSKTWYLAEGATDGGFETWILVQNPGEETANATLTFMTEEGEVGGPTVEIAPESRVTVDVSETIVTFHVATVVESDIPVIAERAVYFRRPNDDHHRFGHSSIGATEASNTWYIGEGASAGHFETWILIQNPGEETANADLTYMTREGVVEGPFIEVEPMSRQSVRIADTVETFHVSTKVESDNPVVAARSVYRRYPEDGSEPASAHSSIGVTAPSQTWYLAEGATKGGFETWVLVQNPGEETANVDLTYMTEDGVVVGPSLEIAPMSRETVRVSDTITTFHISTMVQSDQSVIAERAVYHKHRGHRSAHSSIGVTDASETWYLAEGATAGGFETWIVVQNPGDEAANVTLTYMTDEGLVEGPTFELASESRESVNVGDTVKTFHVSTMVVSDQPVVGARSLYRRHLPRRQGPQQEK